MSLELLPGIEIYIFLKIRQHWGPGPWEHEPDKAIWIDRPTGYHCMVWRGTLGAWCGYVAVPPEHPYHGTDYSELDIDVHGGLTFGNKFKESDTRLGLGDYFWFGFDCAHAGDLFPGDSGLRMSGAFTDYVYRDLEYVVSEVQHLAAQLYNLRGQ